MLFFKNSAKYDCYGTLLDNGRKMYTQDRIGKDRLELDNNIANKESNNISNYINSLNLDDEDFPDFLK